MIKMNISETELKKSCEIKNNFFKQILRYFESTEKTFNKKQ